MMSCRGLVAYLSISVQDFGFVQQNRFYLNIWWCCVFLEQTFGDCYHVYYCFGYCLSSHVLKQLINGCPEMSHDSFSLVICPLYVSFSLSVNSLHNSYKLSLIAITNKLKCPLLRKQGPIFRPRSFTIFHQHVVIS